MTEEQKHPGFSNKKFSCLILDNTMQVTKHKTGKLNIKAKKNKTYERHHTSLLEEVICLSNTSSNTLSGCVDQINKRKQFNTGPKKGLLTSFVERNCLA